MIRTLVGVHHRGSTQLGDTRAHRVCVGAVAEFRVCVHPAGFLQDEGTVWEWHRGVQRDDQSEDWSSNRALLA
jgi:hypothetical protein